MCEIFKQNILFFFFSFVAARQATEAGLGPLRPVQPYENKKRLQEYKTYTR